MKRLLFAPLLAVVFVLLGGTLFLALNNGPGRPTAEIHPDATGVTPDREAPNPQSLPHDAGRRTTRSASPIHNTSPILLSKNFGPPSSEVFSPQFDHVIRRVLSERWIDPEGKANRRRIRIVEADFKYPMLRIEEEVSWNPENSRFEGTLRAASVADHLMVKQAAGQDPLAVVRVLEGQGFGIRRSGEDELLLVEIPDSADVAALTDAMDRLDALDEFVDFAEPDYLVFPCRAPNDPLYQAGRQWPLENRLDSRDSLSDADIDAEEAWDIRTSASNITVAVLDTGVRHTHEDLASRMWRDGSGNPGWDAYDNDNDPMDIDGHGTHCAGIIGAAGNNSLGITGVAWDVKLMAVRFIGPLGGTTSDAIRSMNFARLNGADIISASWGGSGYSRGLLAAIEACYDANIPVVTAAGNERWDIDARPQYPASYPTPNIVSVAATTRMDTLTTFSNYGFTAIDLAAPGEDVISCGIGSDSDYQFSSGTSVATPHVAGALALAKAHYGPEAVDNLVLRLLRSVDRVAGLEGKVAYGGRLNLHQLLQSGTTGIDHDFFNSPFVFKHCSGYWCRSNGSLTREPDEDSYSPNTGQRSAWFQWTAPADGLMRFGGSVTHADVSVVAFEGTTRNTLRRMKDNFAERPTRSSDLRFYVQKDKTYTFSVDSRSSVNQIAAADFNFTPANDMFAHATQIPAGDRFQVEGANCSATLETFEKSLPHRDLVQDQSVWWKWTPAVSGEYVISTLGSNFDTVLGVYQKTGGGLLALGVNDSRSLTDDTSRLELQLEAGTEYHIVVASYWKYAAGDIVLSGFPKEQIRFLQQPQSQLVRLGDPFQLSVLTDTTSEATFQWHGPQGPLAGVGNRSRIEIPFATAGDMGDYHVVVRDGEAVGQSDDATITQLALRPRFLFSPQDVSVLNGTDIQLFAKADGFPPVELRWFKNGAEIQTGHLLTLPNATTADTAIYHVEATDAVGTTRSHPFQIQVSTSGFGDFNYRSPGLPSGLLGMKYINGRHMGYGMKGLLLLSPNGVTWDNPTFPGNFHTFNDIAYESSLGLYVLVGTNNFDQVRTAVSLDGRNWTANPAPISMPTVTKVVAGNGVFVGYSTWYANKVYLSTNGVDWVPHEYTTPGSEMAKRLENIEFFNGEFIGGGRGVIYRSSDGMSWSEYPTPNDGALRVLDNQLITFTGNPVSVSTSPDGTNWTAPVPCVNPPSNFANNLTRISSNGFSLYFALGTTVSRSVDGVVWDSIGYEFDATSMTSSSVSLHTISGPEGNLVASGNTSVLHGPNHRQLARLNTQPLMTIPPITHIFGNTIYQLDKTTNQVVYSNDLRTWRRHTIIDPFDGESLVKGQGKYWALRIGISDTSTLLSGHTPLTLSPHTEGTHVPAILYLAEWNDQVYGCNGDQVFRLDANSNWQPVYTMPKPSGSLEKIRGIITTDRGVMIWSTNGPIYASTNGVSWARVMAGISPVAADTYHPTSSNRFFGPSLCEFDSKVYLYISGTNRMYVANTGFSFVEQQNLNPFSRLISVPQGLLGIEGTIGWFSPNGTTWQQFTLPHETNFLYGYNGTLVAYSSRGIYQAGIPTSSAPITTVRNLGENQSVASGSVLSVDYSVLDPEDRFDRIEMYLNGVLVAQSTDAEGQSNISFNGTGRQVVEIRSYDQDGQVTVDFWQITGTSNLPDKVVETAIIAPSAYSASVWDGRLQIGIDQELFARFPEGWVRRGVPFSAASAVFVSSPDVMLAAGPNLGFSRNVLASNDGIIWRGLDFSVQSIEYQDSWFLARNYRAVGMTSTVSLAVSRDGISWRTANTGNLAVAAGNGNIVGLGGTGFQPSTIRVSEDGATWTSYPGDDMKFIAFESGFFCGIGNQTFKRSVDGKTWIDLSPPLGATETIQNLDIAGGFHYLLTRESNDYHLWFSRDQGETWEKQTGTPAIPRQISYGNGQWFCVASDGLYSSADGIRWVESISLSEITSGALPVSRNRGLKFHTHEGGVSLLMSNGIWTTQDGLEWVQEETPRTGQSPEFLTEPLVLDVSTQRTIMQNRVLLSQDGVVWKQCPLTVSSGKTPRQIAIHDGILLVYASATNGAAELWRSSDGISFTLVNLSPSITLQTMVHDGTRFFATGTVAGASAHLTSTDGVNWTTITPPGSGSVFLYNQTFIVLAPRIAGNPGRQDIHHSPDGISWQTKTLVNGSIQSLTFGNGVFLGAQSNTFWTGTSIDNLALLPSTVSPYLGQVAFAHGSFFLMTPEGLWRSALGETWEPLYSSLAGSLEVTAGTAYIRATSNLRPVLPPDLQVTSVTSVPSNLAVGDRFPASVTFRNIGLAPIPEGTTVRFRGILSRDGKLGNGDDISAGTVEAILDAGIPIGGAASLGLEFHVPALEAGGRFSLIVVADLELPEMTRANNIAITETVAVQVDEFVLNTVRNGDGEVNQSLSALRYANGTLVTLSATAGKGSGFNGWSGSRVSPLSQITMLMNQNQTLTANFVASATLQLSIQGSGEVDGWADPGTYPVGQTATLFARPNEGWEFAGWAGGATSTNPNLSLVINENTSLTAVFRQSLSAWKAMHFTWEEFNDPMVSGDLVDADHDGVPNWQEYLHGSDPMEKRSSGILQSGVDGGFIHMIYTRNTGASLPYALSCEGSRNFTDWDAPDLEERILSVVDGIETIETRMPATGTGNDQGFLRMRYVQP